MRAWLSRRRLDAEQRILSGLDLHGDPWCYGLDLMRACGLRSGRFYPTIHRLENAGLVEARWDNEPIGPGGKYRRRLYRLAPILPATQEHADA